jgi:hypothetical protein
MIHIINYMNLYILITIYDLVLYEKIGQIYFPI